ncbi:MAG: hypothetical protein VX955_05000 [Pseudomonadota bacterium]|nr:hypothetical protein [Pseudomonadota bacterium]
MKLVRLFFVVVECFQGFRIDGLVGKRCRLVTYRAEELIFAFFVNGHHELLRRGEFGGGFHRRFVG